MTVTPCGSCTAPVPDGYLCTGCTGKLAGALKLAADIAPDLDDAVARLLRRGGGGKSASPEPPLPFDIAASDAAAALKNEVGSWARIVAETWTDSVMDWPADETASIARWLGGRMRVIRNAQWSPDMLHGVRAAVDRALAVVDRKPEMVPLGACPQCGRDLAAELGSDEALCSCGYWTAGIIARHRERARQADKLMTPSELSAALAACGYTVAPGTISSWGTRGLIERRPGGYYRLVDAIDRAARRH